MTCSNLKYLIPITIKIDTLNDRIEITYPMILKINMYS